MNKLIPLIFLLFFVTELSAQNLSVSSFKKDASDMAARVTDAVTDQNGEKCALIKIRTTQQGFVFEGDMLGIAKTIQKTGEVWVYVPAKARRLTIKHPQLGVLSYTYGDPIEEATVYIMQLSTGNVVTTVVPLTAQTQWLVLTSEPTGANVYINDVYKGATPYQQEIPDGSYSYRLEYPLYHTNAGKFEMVGKEGKKELALTLKPNFGKISISSQPEAGATVLLDGKPTQLTTPCEIEQVLSGEHTVLLQKEWYEPLSQKVTVLDEQTAYVSPTMVPTFANVTVNAQYEAEIYVDGVFQKKGTWQGRLISGYHTFEAKKEKYGDGLTKVTVVAGEDKVIELSPTPKYGRLKIVTTPYNAAIKLNGIEYGTTPNTLSELLIGTYTLELSSLGYVTHTQTVEITENETKEINATMQTGLLVSFTSAPAGAKISISGKEIGVTPCKVALEEGDYDVTFLKDNYEKIEKSIRVSQNSVNHAITLRGRMLPIRITSTPKKAQIKIDNEVKGKTDLELTLQAGTRKINVAHNKFTSINQTIEIGDEKELHFTLEPQKLHSKGGALVYSLLWPGAGQSYLNRGGAGWLWGIAGYGLVAGSFIQNQNSKEAYDNYKNADNASQRNDYLENAEKYYTTSQRYMYGAIGVWAFNFIYTLTIPSDKKRYGKVKPTSGVDTKSGTPLLGLKLEF